MSERNTRDAIDRMTKRIVEHTKQTGKPVSHRTAQDMARDTARRVDRKYPQK